MPESSPQTSQPLLQEFLNLLREKKYSENSLQSHRLDLQKYLDWLGDGGEVRLEQLQVLKPADIQDYVEYLYQDYNCLLYTSPSPRDATTSRMPSSA